jgi:peptidoglycan/LPS O-acetylase OafA/YrhL
MTTPLPPPPPVPPRLSWVPTLDGLRGLAVLAVVAFHAGHLQGGYLGVDLFFTVSGFLITRLILDDLSRRRFRLGSFWARRARRGCCWPC